MVAVCQMAADVVGRVGGVTAYVSAYVTSVVSSGVSRCAALGYVRRVTPVQLDDDVVG
jgi:hypothetical protein